MGSTVTNKVGLSLCILHNGMMELGEDHATDAHDPHPEPAQSIIRYTVAIVKAVQRDRLSVIVKDAQCVGGVHAKAVAVICFCPSSPRP